MDGSEGGAGGAAKPAASFKLKMKGITLPSSQPTVSLGASLGAPAPSTSPAPSMGVSLGAAPSLSQQPRSQAPARVRCCAMLLCHWHAMRVRGQPLSCMHQNCVLLLYVVPHKLHRIASCLVYTHQHWFFQCCALSPVRHQPRFVVPKTHTFFGCSHLFPILCSRSHSARRRRRLRAAAQSWVRHSCVQAGKMTAARWTAAAAGRARSARRTATTTSSRTWICRTNLRQVATDRRLSYADTLASTMETCCFPVTNVLSYR